MGDGFLGAIDVGRFVVEPFTEHARFDFDGLSAVAEVAVRMLDNAIEHAILAGSAGVDDELVSRRPIGLGMTGLADALMMLGLRYDAPAGQEMAAAVARRLRDAAYAASAELARERGACPGFDAGAFLASGIAGRLRPWLRDRILESGMRNLQVTALFPMEKLSVAFADCASSGTEPPQSWRPSLRAHGEGSVDPYGGENRAHRLYRALGHDEKRLPVAFRSAAGVSVDARIDMAGIVASFVDTPPGKVVTLPAGAPADARQDAVLSAWRAGLGMVSVEMQASVAGNDPKRRSQARPVYS